MRITDTKHGGKMKLPRNRLRTALLLGVVFAALFFAVFFLISATQTAYSTPATMPEAIYRNGSRIPLAIGLGPVPNSTNVPLNTTIVVFQLRGVSVENLHLTPEVPISGRTDAPEGLASEIATFYPATPLNPDTTYNVSAEIAGTPYSWVFTTTSEPFKPDISYYLATYVFWIALATAIAGTCIAGELIWQRRKNY